MSITLEPRNRIGPKGPQGPEGPQGPQGFPGADGARWWDGRGAPNPNLGAIGDYYLDDVSGDVFRKFEDGWNKQGNIKGPKGPKGDQGPAGFSQTVVTTFKKKGRIIFMYNEITLTPNDTGSVLEYTVPADKYLDALMVLVSGENIGEYRIIKVPVSGPDELLALERTHWEAFNSQVPMERATFSPGEKLRVSVLNADTYDPDSSSFNATLIGDLYGTN